METRLCSALMVVLLSNAVLQNAGRYCSKRTAVCPFASVLSARRNRWALWRASQALVLYLQMVVSFSDRRGGLENQSTVICKPTVKYLMYSIP